MNSQPSPDLPGTHAIGFISARNLLADNNQIASESAQRAKSPIGSHALDTQSILPETSEFEYDPFSDDFGDDHDDNKSSDGTNDHSPGNRYTLCTFMFFLKR